MLDGMSEPDLWDPGSPRNRDRTRESKRQVRGLLMAWDPIGVSGVPEAANEYDCMISPLLHCLFEGAGTRSLAELISHERSSHFGLGPDVASDRQLAESLTAWWETRRGTATLHCAALRAAEVYVVGVSEKQTPKSALGRLDNFSILSNQLRLKWIESPSVLILDRCGHISAAIRSKLRGRVHAGSKKVLNHELATWESKYFGVAIYCTQAC